MQRLLDLKPCPSSPSRSCGLVGRGPEGQEPRRDRGVDSGGGSGRAQRVVEVEQGTAGHRLWIR